MNKEKLITRLFHLGIALGLCAATYPFVASAWNTHQQQKQASGYASEVTGWPMDQYQRLWQETHEWNDALYAHQNGLTEEMEEQYPQLLSLENRNAVIGILDIPSIDVRLPVYHGTSEEVLAKGIGHLEKTSMIEGGENRHTVLSGHRGLPGSRLLTDLNYVVIGDLLKLEALDETLYYKVDQIKTVLPTETNDLWITPDHDYLTLITCTPYGLNTHRLLVRGERFYPQSVDDLPKVSWKAKLYKWILPICTAIVAFVMMGAIAWYYRRYQKKRC